MNHKKRFVLYLVLIWSAWISSAFSAPPIKNEMAYSHPVVIKAVRHDVSKPLRQIAKQYKENYEPKKPWIIPKFPVPVPKQTYTPFVVDKALQNNLVTPLNVTIKTSFKGFGVSRGDVPSVAPPDTTGAVGRVHYVQWVNVDFIIFNKANGNIVMGPTPGNQLWTGFGGNCENDNDGDIIVLYDREAARWIFSQFAVSSAPPFSQCVAISQTEDATGPYFRYEFQFADFNDYPKIGVWPDGYYISFNMFNNSNVFIGPNACVMDRDNMLLGQPATMQCFQLDPTQAGTLLPSDNSSSSTSPPLGSPNFFVGLDPNSTSNLLIWKFHTDWTTPANSTFTEDPLLSVTPYTPACNGGVCIPQPSPATVADELDSLADRVMYRASYRNFGDHAALLVNHSVQPGNGAASGIRWYELRIDLLENFSVFQQGTFSPDTNSRWMGSMAMDKDGNIAIGYSKSSNSVFPEIDITGRRATDPLNTLQDEVQIIPGSGVQLGTGNRWGDYSTMVVDPDDESTFWYTQEYLTTVGSFNWSTYITSFKFSNVPPPPVVIAPTITVAVRNPLDPVSAFLYFNPAAGGSTGADVTYSVSGIPGAFVSSRDNINNRFVVSHILNPRAIPNVSIVVHKSGGHAISNPITVPSILGMRNLRLSSSRNLLSLDKSFLHERT